MLAIKECLIREGVLNLDSPHHHHPVSSQRHFQLQSSKSSGNMDMPRYRQTIAASSDLSTASATAKTSCQAKQQQQPQQPTTTDESESAKVSYRGQHPHFHHHTTPAYYTDLQLRIHTPNASDVGALNENYQSVYSTPSTQLVEQRCFPKTQTQRASFFRLGDTVATTDNSNPNTKNNTRRQRRSSKERCAKSLPPSVSPTKGEEEKSKTKNKTKSNNHNSNSPCSHNNSKSPVVETIASSVVVVSLPVGGATTTTSGRSSRHAQRFQQRSKRAVRVRSESRPISALYDIICKEKGLDVGDTTTTSSSSHNSSSNEEEQTQQQPLEQQQSDQQQQQQKSNTLATFWPLHHQYHRASMSGAKQQQQQLTEPLNKPTQRQQKRLQKLANNDCLSGEDDDDDVNSPYALHSSQKVTNLSPGKANSLPPPADYLKCQAMPLTAAPQLPTPAHNHGQESHARMAKSLEPLAKKNPSEMMMPVSTEHMFVEPPKLSLPELKCCLVRNKDEEKEQQAQELKEEHGFDQDQVIDTLARWQQELSSTSDKSAQLLNGANGHHHPHHQHHPQYELDHRHHHHEVSPTFDHQAPVAVEALNDHQAQSQSNYHQHQATNARRFITRTPRSASRQSAGGHSSPPPPPQAAGYHSDSSYSSPSPTRRQQQQQQQQLGATATGSSGAADPQSSTNGNSSAYETAATTVMTHATPATTDCTQLQQQQQQQQHHPQQEVEVPKTSQTNATSNVIIRPAAINSDRKKEEEQQQQQRQRYSSPSSSIRTSSTPPTRRLSSSELSPKGSAVSGFNSEPSGSSGNSSRLCSARSASQPAEAFVGLERRPFLLANANNVSMKQNLSELHFTGGILSPQPKVECTLRMRPRSSTLCADAENPLGSGAAGKARDNLTNLQLSPVQKHKRTPEASPLPRRAGDRDKSAKRKSNLNRSYNEEATKDGDETASTRRRRRRELGMARPLMPGDGDDESLRELLQSPQKSSCSESTTSKSESLRQQARGINQKFNERTKMELAEIKKIAEQAQAAGNDQPGSELKMSPILRRKSTDDVAAATAQNSPPAPNQIVSILKKKEHAFGECNSSASSNASPVTFSANVLDTPLAGSRSSSSKRQGILKKRSSLDESRYYSRSHSPDERSILIKSARRNSLEEAGLSLSPGLQSHGILKQSSYDSSKSDGCPSANDCQPHSILKKKDSLSTPSDGGGGHVSKHVSISQAVTLAAAELAAHDGLAGIEDGGSLEENEGIRPILKQESTSSEEAARPPKPILKKKSFGEADEHEMIRPILKGSRKSSREEFDLTGLSPDANNDTVANDGMRPILKTDSPSKRRSLGSTQEEDESSSSLLKRRTRSLERQDAAPVMDLAAALDAITNTNTNSQAHAPAPATPVDFVSNASSISVAERIKHMESLSTPPDASRTAGGFGINSSWESPLQQTPQSLHDSDSGAAPKLLKPSVLRRDLYRDRYKTQPVTNEEKSFFKANSTPFDISATSAFRPTKPLDIRNGSQQQQQPLISPITGQPLSHVPAPLLLSSSTNSGAGASFRLARSSTQPLQSPRVVHLAAQGGSATPPSSLTRQQSINDNSLSEQLTLSVGNDTERIFEMSGLDDDSAIQSLGDNASSTTTTATSTTTTQSTGGAGVGVARSSSVRARANMFQQLQQQEQSNRSRRETAGGETLPLSQSRSFANRQATSRHSPPPSASLGSPLNDEPSTPNTTQDATDADFGKPKGILKGGKPLPGMGRGLMPIDLNAELKNRLQRSTHATVSNLRKSATTANATTRDETDNSSTTTTSTANPQRNLAQILRNVSKENATPTSTHQQQQQQHDDAVSLVRNLATLGAPRAVQEEEATTRNNNNCASASEGESSGGREIEAIIKNSAVARRRRQQQHQQQQQQQQQQQLPDGSNKCFLAKVKPIARSYYWRPVQPPRQQQQQPRQQQQQQLQRQQQQQPLWQLHQQQQLKLPNFVQQKLMQ